MEGKSVYLEIIVPKIEETILKETISLLKEIISMGINLVATNCIIPSFNIPCNLWIHNLEWKCECVQK